MNVKIDNNEVKLYGRIWSGDGAYIVRLLEGIKADILKVHLHTPGGDVIDGNLIYNHLASRNTHTYNDGLVASMGAVLFEAGQKRFMVKNGFIMRHAPRGSAYGRAKDLRKTAEILENLEESFVELYMTNNGVTREKAEEWLDGDNYFSSSKAMELKMADEIIDPVLPKANLEGFRAVATTDDFPEEMFQLEGSLHRPQPDNSKNDSNKNDSQMKKEVIEAFKLQDVTAESSDTAVIAAMQKKMSQLESAASTSKTALEALEKSMKDKEDTDIKAAIDTAEKEGLITAEMKDHYSKIGNDSGLEVLNAVLGSMKKRPSIAAAVQTGSGGAAPSADMSWDEYQKKDPEALEAMGDPSSPNHETFKALFKAKFKTEYQA